MTNFTRVLAGFLESYANIQCSYNVHFKDTVLKIKHLFQGIHKSDLCCSVRIACLKTLADSYDECLAGKLYSNSV